MRNSTISLASLLKAGRHNDLIVGLAIFGVLFILLIPLPPWLLDILFAINITTAIFVLMMTLYTTHPLEFSVFPSLLLILTLFRLSLNVSSTRLILQEAAAGQIINAFGNFVAGGNPVIGVIVFLILVVIQFVVITKGATRVSEVAARFTLDAMPGKQMSIDADLNAGLISEEQARVARKNISSEADFYGSMDGASKFVRGDAIAAVIITLINILGGFAIGMLQHGMALREALRTYTILTIGDGLVSQVPALIISTAAGIVVTRSTAGETDLGSDLAGQMLAQTRAIWVVSGIMLLMGLIPGMPTRPFLALAGTTGIIAYASKAFREGGRFANLPMLQLEREEGEEIIEKTEERVEELLHVDLMSIMVGYDFVPYVDRSSKNNLFDQIESIRRRFAQDMGFIVPLIHIKDSIKLEHNAYSILIKGIEVARGKLMINKFLAVDYTGASKELNGIRVQEPVFGLTAFWISEDKKLEAEEVGYMVIEPLTVLSTHITEVIKTHAHELLERQTVQRLLDNVQEEHPLVLNELVPDILSVGTIQKVLQNLLREGVSIRDLVTILETLADKGQQIKNSDMLTEYVRQSLARQICNQLADEDRTMLVFTLDDSLESEIAKAIQSTEQGEYLAIAPDSAQQIVQAVSDTLQSTGSMEELPIILCDAEIRPHLQKLLTRFLPNISVLSYNEIASEVKIKSLDVIGLTSDK